MAYEVRAAKRVSKELARLPRQDQARILVAVKRLSDEPRPAGCGPVKAAEPSTYRIRVDDYRVVYVVLDDEQVVLVARVARRSESTYRGLA